MARPKNNACDENEGRNPRSERAAYRNQRHTRPGDDALTPTGVVHVDNLPAGFLTREELLAEVTQAATRCIEEQMEAIRHLLQNNLAQQAAPGQQAEASSQRGANQHSPVAIRPDEPSIGHEDVSASHSTSRCPEPSARRSAVSAYRRPAGRGNKVEPHSEGADLRDQLDAIRARVDDLAKERGKGDGNRDQVAIATDSAFSFAIQRCRFPRKFKMPAVPQYDGNTDPIFHVGNYTTMMRSANADIDGVKCLMFSTTLVGVAATWFRNLKPRSIDSFETLARKFCEHHRTYQQVKPTPGELYTCKQREKESLRTYIHRFNSLLTELPDVDVALVVNALTQGCSDYSLCGALSRTPPMTISELKDVQQMYIRQEETLKMKMAVTDAKATASETPEKRKKEESPSTQNQSKKKKHERQENKGKPPRYNRYTPLSQSPGQILMAIEGKEAIRWPSRSSQTSSIRLGTGKYCRFHRAPGHSTDDCKHLQNEIERLIQRGRLHNYQQGHSHASEPTHQINRDDEDSEEAQHPAGEYPIIHTISGGPSGGGDTSRSRKSYARSVLLTSPAQKRAEPSRPSEVVSFSDDDIRPDVHYPHDDPLVVSLVIKEHQVRRALVDTGSSVNIMFYDAFKQLKVPPSQLQPLKTPLVGFTGHQAAPKGLVTLPVILGDKPSVQLTADFTVVDLPSAFNVIIGRPLLVKARAIPSQFHQKLKFPTGQGVGELLGDQKVARSCYVATLRQSLQVSDLGQHRAETHTRSMPSKEETLRLEPSVKTTSLLLDAENIERTTNIGAELEASHPAVPQFLRTNADVFAWSAEDIPGIDPEVATHRLNVDGSAKPVRQKKRNFAQDRVAAIDEEVDKLLRAGFIKETRYPEWLANVVLVKKSNGKWRMCVDFTDLNKACPKDCFPLPPIDRLVDSTAEHELLSFVDAYSGYHQIPMHPDDAEKTSFITDKGVYHYVGMPFGLINAGATYQRLVTQMFKGQIGRNVEVYVDDMVIKSKKAEDHQADLSEVFSILRKYRMKLNPAKCTFGVPGGKFLGYMVSHRGIEANPDKIKAIRDMKPPQKVREVQRLNGRAVALGRFIAKIGDKCHPFFQAIKKTKDFSWTDECQTAFESLRSYLSSPPVLSSPTPDEPLYLYLAVTNVAVSAVLIREEDRVQKPVYYVSRVLQDAETRYPRAEKFALALIVAARRLRPYFQAHPITVLTDQPLKQIMSRPDVSGRLVKWAVELGEYGVQFKPRTAIKAQALAEFVAETTLPDETPTEPHGEETELRWKLFVDGSSSRGGSGAGLILEGPTGFTQAYALRFQFKASNNEAEYEALITGLKLAESVKARHLDIFSDSQLVVNQVNGDYEARDVRMRQYLSMVKPLLKPFKSCTLSHVPREENSRADALSKLANADFPELVKQILLEVLDKPSTQGGQMVATATDRPDDWTKPLIDYLGSQKLPADPAEARKTSYRASRYILLDGVLYKRSYTAPLLRCLGQDEAKHALSEVHEGECGNHLGARALAHKILRQGFYWPTLQQDAAEFVRKCKNCQFYSNIPRKPATKLTSIQSPVPFAQWGVDIMGPLPTAPGGRRWAILACDYFTKWVEGEALATITEQRVTNFIWKNIFCRFGIPQVLVTDHGRQFEAGAFQEFLGRYQVKHFFSSVAHPQCNGQAEVTVRTITKGLEARLGQSDGRWADELPSILWAYRTTSRAPTGETPFSLAYGVEAVIPVEVDLTSARIAQYDPENNDSHLRSEIDLLEEKREKAALRNAAYKQRTERYHNSRVKARLFKVGDLVLRKVESTGKHVGKLAPKWEGPYKIKIVIRPGTYRLEALNGRPLPNAWNAEHLRVFYQ